MNFKDAMAADLAAVFFNTNEFAEAIEYNEQKILAIPEIGEDNRKGNTFSSEGRSSIAYFWIREADVSRPEASDIIVYAGVSWNVARVTESGGGMHRVECTTRESVFA